MDTVFEIFETEEEALKAENVPLGSLEAMYNCYKNTND